jgi:pre-mRNA-splicing factor SYF1
LALLKKDKEAYLRTFHEALTTINPMRSTGKVSDIWWEFALFYEEAGDLITANNIFSKASASKFKNVEELANIWIFWTEMLLRNGSYNDALSIGNFSFFLHQI